MKENSEDDVRKHFNRIAEHYNYYKEKNNYYYNQLKTLLKEIIKNPENMSVLEIGCGTGDIISSLKPKRGVGMDISDEMIAIARVRHQSEKNLEFKISDNKNNGCNQYDYILLVDLVEHIVDINIFFSELKNQISLETKVIMTSANPMWASALYLAERLSFKMREGPHDWQNFNKLRKLFKESNFRELEFGTRLIFPVAVPLLSEKLNRNFRKYRLLKYLGLTKYLIIETTSIPTPLLKSSKSIIT